MTKAQLFIIPIALLFACGAEESSDSNQGTDSNEGSDSVQTAYHSTYETCSSTNSLSMTKDSLNDSDAFAFMKMEGVDLTTFTSLNAELNKSHKNVRIKFTNNPAILNSGIGQFNRGDISLTISFTPKGGEIVAGEYTDENDKITLTKGEKVDGTSKTGGVGSNKTSRTIIINEISEDHVCGSFAMSNESGLVIIQASFDTDLRVSPF